MNKILLAIVGSVWFGLVFIVGFRFTFPSQAVAERLMYEWQENVEGDIILQVDSVTPSWIGVRARDVGLFQEPGRDEEAAVEMVSLESLTLHTGLIGLLRQQPEVQGRAKMGDGRIDFYAEIGRNDEGDATLRDLEVDATGFPLTALPPVQGAKVEGSGELDLAVELAAADGFGKSDGRVTIRGRDLYVERIDAPGTALEAFQIGEIELHEVDLALDVTQGRAKVSRGNVSSNMADVELEGDILLNDFLPRTRLRLEVVIDVAEEFALLGAAMKDAEWSDGKYHYSLSGTWSRIRWRAERERTRSSSSSSSSLRSTSSKTPEELDAEREERRRRREERLAERRARMRTPREGGPRGAPERPRRPGEVEDYGPEEDEEDYEEHDDEEEDEELLDDEDLPPEDGDLAIPQEGEEYFDE